MHSAHPRTLAQDETSSLTLAVFFCRLAYIFAWTFLCAYMAKVTTSPVYFGLAVCIALGLFGVFLLQVIRVSWDIWTAAGLLAYVMITQSATFWETMTGAYPNLVLGLGGYITVRLIAEPLSVPYQIRVAKLGLWIGTAFLLADSIYRLLHPTIPDSANWQTYEEEGLAFYVFKYGSVMFADSNSTALVAMVFLLFFFSLRQAGVVSRSPLLIILLLLLIIASLSRAAIVAILLVGSLYVFTRMVRQRHARLAIGLLAMTAILAALVVHFSEDGSFQVKVQTWLSALSMERRSGVSLLFGEGIGASERVLGISAHALLVTYYFELGVVGLLLFGFFIVALLRASALTHWPLLGVGIVGLSYFLYLGTPFLFVPLATLVNVDRRQRIGQ